MLTPSQRTTYIFVGLARMSRMPSNRSGQSFIEYALIIILFAIVLLSILLIFGDDLRVLINDLFQRVAPSQTSGVLGAFG